MKLRFRNNSPGAKMNANANTTTAAVFADESGFKNVNSTCATTAPPDVFTG